jgi:CRP-like cAMP-binding protein
MHQATIARVTKGTLARCIRQKPAFAKLFISHLLSRISRSEDNVMDQLFNDSERRLARVLVLLASFGEQSNPWGTTPKMGQATLAQMVGTTRSRVSFFMNRFRKRGLIHYNGELQIHRLLLDFIRSGEMPPGTTTIPTKG